MRERSLEIVSDRDLNGPEGVNRKLIHASLSAVTEQVNSGHGARKKPPPPEQTHAEDFYYLKQMGARTPMVVVLGSGEVLHGVIEWYDKQCIKLNRFGRPNLLIMKSAIRYLYKQPNGTPSKAELAGSREMSRFGSGHDTTTKINETEEMGLPETAKVRTSVT
jgi:host factor-I protein